MMDQLLIYATIITHNNTIDRIVMRLPLEYVVALKRAGEG